MDKGCFYTIKNFCSLELPGKCRIFFIHGFTVKYEVTIGRSSVTVAHWNRCTLGMEQVVSSIPGSVGYISHPMFIELTITYEIFDYYEYSLN